MKLSADQEYKLLAKKILVYRTLKRFKLLQVDFKKFKKKLKVLNNSKIEDLEDIIKVLIKMLKNNNETNYNHVLKNLQDYMLDETNMKKSLEMKLVSEKKIVLNVKDKDKEKTIDESINQNNMTTEEHELKLHDILKNVWTEDDKEIVLRFFQKMKSTNNEEDIRDDIDGLEALLISIHKKIEKEVKILSSI